MREKDFRISITNDLFIYFGCRTSLKTCKNLKKSFMEKKHIHNKNFYFSSKCFIFLPFKEYGRIFCLNLATLLSILVCGLCLIVTQSRYRGRQGNLAQKMLTSHKDTFYLQRINSSIGT